MVSVGDIISGAFRLFRERIGALAIWLLLYLAMTVGMQLLLRPAMRELMLQPAGAAPDLSRIMGAAGTMGGVYLLFMVAMLILYTAAIRAVVRPQENSFAYLRLGMDELRMLLLGLVFFVAFILLYLLMAMLMGVFVAILSAASPGAAIASVIIWVVAIFVVMIFFYVRFSLAFALTMVRRRIAIGEAWRLSSGRFWMLFGAYIVVMLIVFGMFSVLIAVTQGSYFSDLAHAGFAPGASEALQRQQMERQFGTITGMTVFGWLIAAAAGTVWLALGAGVTGTAALGLLDDRFADVGAIYE